MNVIVKLDRDNDSVIMIVMFFFPMLVHGGNIFQGTTM